MLARTGVAFQGRGFEPHRGDSTTLFTPNYYAARHRKSHVFVIRLHEIPHSSIRKAPGSQSRRLRFETRILIFLIFHFSLFSWNSHWRTRALMTIRFQHLLIVHLFEEDACFLETYI